jgi:hypothetical protein
VYCKQCSALVQASGRLYWRPASGILTLLLYVVKLRQLCTTHLQWTLNACCCCLHSVLGSVDGPVRHASRCRLVAALGLTAKGSVMNTLAALH